MDIWRRGYAAGVAGKFNVDVLTLSSTSIILSDKLKSNNKSKISKVCHTQT